MVTGAVYPEVAALLGLDVAARVAQLLAGVQLTRVESKGGVCAIVPLDRGRDNLAWPVPRPLIHASRLNALERAAFRVPIEWLRVQLTQWVEAGEPFPWAPKVDY